MSDIDALFEQARADPLAAWAATRERFDRASAAEAIDAQACVALAAVLAGAASRAAELCVGDREDPDFQRRFGAVASHASTAEMLARRGGGGLAVAAIARESMRYSCSAIEVALATARSNELDAIARAALSLRCDPLLPADERLDRALARDRLGISA